MTAGESTAVSGYVTKDKFIRGRSLAEIELILGFRSGRFQSGIAVIGLNRLPALGEFELAAYTMIAEHRFQQPGGLVIDKLKHLALESWSLTGFERLVKVRPNSPHDPEADLDSQYPPGTGAPQWKLTAKLPGNVVDVIEKYPDGRYQLPI